MGDRIDEGWMREQAKEMREERQADLKAAGPLLNEGQKAELQSFLKTACWMKPADANDVVDTISQLAGEKGSNAKQVVRDALEGHVSKVFLKNEGNFKPVTGMLEAAIAAREARIVTSHKPATASPATSAPQMKS